MRFECWITEATDTLGIYSIISFVRQQWLHERASALRYACMFMRDQYV